MSNATPTYQLTDRLTRQEAAAVLGISVSMLAQYRRDEKIVSEKNAITGAVRFVYADVLVLKAAREENGARVTGTHTHRQLPRSPRMIAQSRR
jgi:transcriptional regulator with XRE-family HTH domain